MIRLKLLKEGSRIKKVGLWQDSNPIPPWELRKEDELGQKIKRFNLGKPNSEFFRYDKATNTKTFENSILINSPCRFVNVMVESDSK